MLAHADPPSTAPRRRASPALRRVGWLLAAAVLVLAPLAGRVAIDGRAQLEAADAAAEAGDAEAEIRHLGRAARLVLPLAGHDERARARLAELARSAVAADEVPLALAAWRELRRALIGARVIDVAEPELLAEANAAIVELMVRERVAAGAGAGAGDRERWAAELAEASDPGPRGRSLLAALAFAGWLGACVGLVVRGIDSKGHLDPVPARRWGAALLVGLVAWILLM